MKNKFGISGVLVAALCGTLQGSVQATATDSAVNNDQPGKFERADKIIGREVTDSQNQKLGRVKDLAVDLQNGRIVEVVVGTGGVLGVDEKYVMVPPEQFTCDAANNTLLLKADTSKFTEAPTFKLSDWQANVREPDVTQVYQYYGATPYYTVNESDRSKSQVPIHLGDVQRADSIIGSPVHNLQDDRIGRVNDLIVDLPAGRVAEVVVATGGFLGMGDELSAVPPQSFRQGNEPNTLVLDTTKEALSSAPHFKSSEWPDLNDTNYMAGVYRSYNVQPYFSVGGNPNEADNTAQNVRDRNGNTVTPFDQGNSQADLDTTQEIRKQIMAADGLSVNARNVKVITMDGRVVLRGTVNTPEEKRIIGNIANKVASPGNVNDQLQVENMTKS
jgi:sporulation protein YlmC with PRC-barrel domain